MRPASDCQRQNPNRWFYGVATAAVLGGALSFYASLFGTMSGFVSGMDRGYTLFRDFIDYYYPMGQSLFAIREPVKGFFYSPFFAILLSGFSTISFERAIGLWALFEVLATVALFALPVFSLKGAKRAGAWYLGYLAIFATSFPVLHNFRWGQVSVLVALLGLGAAYAYRAERSRTAAAFLSLAIAVKFYPAFLLTYFIAKRERRYLVPVLVTSALLLVVIPVLFLGPADTFRFYVTAFAKVSSSAWFKRDTNSQYIGSVVARLIAVPHARTFGGGVGVAVVVSNTWMIWRLARRESQIPDAILWAAALVFLSVPFAVRTSWPHYFSYLPFVQLLVAREVAASPDRGIGFPLQWVGISLSILLASVFAFALFPGWYDYGRWGCLFFANAILLVAVWYHLGKRWFAVSKCPR